MATCSEEDVRVGGGGRGGGRWCKGHCEGGDVSNGRQLQEGVAQPEGEARLEGRGCKQAWDAIGGPRDDMT